MSKLMLILIFLIVLPSQAADPETVASSTSPVPVASGSAAAPKRVRKIVDPNACLTDPAAVEDIQKQKQELEERVRLLAKREAELVEKQKALEEELERLKGIRADIDKSDLLKKKENEEKVAKLMETMESMSPKAAALLLANVDENLAVTAMMQLPSGKLAKMMGLIEPAKASRLSEKLTGIAPKAEPEKPAVQKGG